MDILQYSWQHSGPTDAHGHFMKPLLGMLPPGSGLTIADLGCGNGYLASVLAGMGHKVFAVDSSREGIDIARTAFPDITFHCLSLYEDLKNEMNEDFDVVIASEVIEHLYDPRKFLHNAFELLKPGGTLILSTPYHGYLKNLALAISGKMDKHFTAEWDCGHIKFFSVKSLSRMVREYGYCDLQFRFAGRLPYLWKSMILQARKPIS